MFNLNGLYLFLIFVQIVVIFFPQLLIIQALFIFSIGLVYSFKANDLKVIKVISFISGSEVYYKQSAVAAIGSSIPWEFPKYAIFLICILFFLSSFESKRYYSFSILIYSFLIFISVLYTLLLNEITFEGVKSIMGFYVMGPFALGATILAFDNVKISLYDFKIIILYYAAGIFPSIIFLIKNLSIYSTIKVIVDSNQQFSGYGPIHVSLAISFLIGLLILSIIKYHLWKNVILPYIVIVISFVLMMLTFSRSGVYALLPSVFIAFLYQPKNIKSILSVALISIVSLIIILTKLNNFTNDALQLRYTIEENDPRFALMKSDFDAWLDNPVFGAGFGRAKKYRERENRGLVSHNEISRVLAEQGILGFFCILIILSIVIDRIKRERLKLFMPYILFLTIFSFIFFNSNAFRLYLPGFSLGLVFLSVNQTENHYSRKPNLTENKKAY